MAAPISATRALAPRGLLERDDELERLLRAVAAAERGDGALAVVEGETGIGKTSLLDAVCAEARERGFSVLPSLFHANSARLFLWLAVGVWWRRGVLIGRSAGCGGACCQGSCGVDR
jgi:hypothetical protein